MPSSENIPDTPGEIARDATRWLKERSRRYARWAACCGVFAILVTLLAVVTGVAAFAVVAAFFFFFTWNRALEWRRVHRWLAHPPNANEQEVEAWTKAVVSDIHSVPAWERVSNWVTGITAVSIFLLQLVLILTISGLRMRVFYGFIYGFAGLLLFTRLWMIRRARTRHREVHVSPDPWIDLT